MFIAIIHMNSGWGPHMEGPPKPDDSLIQAKDLVTVAAVGSTGTLCHLAYAERWWLFLFVLVGVLVAVGAGTGAAGW